MLLLRPFRQAQKKLKQSIPARWRQVLGVADGFRVEDAGIGDGEAFIIASSCKLAAVHGSSAKMARLTQESFSDQMLGFAESEGGDMLFLDTSKQTKDGDCPVMRLDHETGDTISWPSLASFLIELLEPREEE